MTRRKMLKKVGVGAGVGIAAVSTSRRKAAAKGRSGDEPVGFCLNTSTIRGQKLSLVEEIEIAGKTGYQGIEPWINEIEQYVEAGGKLKDLKKRIADLGLVVVSAIGFANWIVDDRRERAKGLETAKRDMDLVRRIGGARIAAPPAGAIRQKDLDPFKAAERYRALLELGDKTGVVPQLELWGFSEPLHRLGEVALVAVESGHPSARVLLDVYHIYKGGSDFHGLKLIEGSAIEVFHFNDYPADPPRSRIRDADRVYPGDGVAPLRSILRDIHRTGFRGMLSLELFNPEYWQRDALSVARTGLRKMRSAVKKSLS